YAQTIRDNAVVRDLRGNVVTSIQSGTCVRTKWEAGLNECNPGTRVTQVVNQRKTVLGSEDRVVYFNFNSADLSADAQTRLNSAARTLIAAKDIQRVDIVGYADRKGSHSYNEALSKRRANAV